MKKIKLLPYNCKILGIGIVLCTIVWNLFRIFKYHLFTDPFDPLISAIQTFGFSLMIFSKEKCEDEFINQLRLRSFYSTMLFMFVWVIIVKLMTFATGSFVLESFNIDLVYVQAFYVLYFYYLLKKNHFFRPTK
ncbi:hypothetical protein ABIB40_001155 [Pedobacter sp. UYP30]